MGIATASCLKLPPPTPSSNLSSSISKKPQVSWFRNEKLRRQCVVGMACMVIGLEMTNLVSNEEMAIAKEMQIEVESNDQKQKGLRWSDKRTCPQWRLNSLETIVPENLPRPSARRRFESIDYSNIAPSTRVMTAKTATYSSCFSV